MTNKSYLLVVLFLISITYNSSFAQVVVKNNEIIGIKDSAIYLKLDTYIGDIQWEMSDDGINWTEIHEEKKDSISISTEINSFYRAKVTVDNCDSFYSDTTQFKKGEIVPLKAEVFPQEICYLKLENIVLEDSIVHAKLNGENIELRYTGKYIVFLMPQLTSISPKLDLILNTREYSFDYSILEPLPESSLKQFYSEFLTSNNETFINFKNSVDELIKLDSVNFSDGYFDRFLFVLDSIQNELNQFSNNLSTQEIQEIAQIIAANPLLFKSELPNIKSAEVNLDALTLSSPEAMLEDLPGFLYNKTEELEVASSQAGGYFDLVIEVITGRVIEFALKKLQIVISKAFENIIDIQEKKEMLGSYLQIKAIIENTRNQVRNPYYIQEGFLDTGNPLEILKFNSKESKSLTFLSWYVQMTNEDLKKFPDVNSALDRFNSEFKRTNNLPLHQVFNALGLPVINQSYPIRAHETEPDDRYRKRTRKQVENKYIVSKEADIISSISNSNVKLTAFSKDTDGPLNLQFENLTSEEQEFNFSVNYEHKGYKNSATNLKAILKAIPDDRNYFKIGDKEYDLSVGILVNYGTDYPYYQGHAQELVFYSEGISLLTNEYNNALYLTGKGHIIGFSIYSTSGNALDNGDYNFSSTDPSPIGTFDEGVYGIDWEDYSEEKLREIVSGKVSVFKNGSEYNITINCTDENGEKITGFYKGSLRYFVD